MFILEKMVVITNIPPIIVKVLTSNISSIIFKFKNSGLCWDRTYILIYSTSLGATERSNPVASPKSPELIILPSSLNVK